MRKLIRVLSIAGPIAALCLGTAVLAEQDWRVGGSAPQAEALTADGAEEALPSSWKRGDVVMPDDPLLAKMAAHQERSQNMYKSMTFEQKSVIERYKPANRLWEREKVSQHRELVVRYRPLSSGELEPELISDSDQKAWSKHLKNQQKEKEGKKKKKAKNKESLAKQLISPILFPMTTENVQHCKFTVLLALPDMLLLRFEPMGTHQEPIFEGQVFVNPQTGEISRLEIDHLWNFEKVNGKFKHLKEFYVAVDYPEQPGGHRFPTEMDGRGYAKVWFVKGYFRFRITESGYSPASDKPLRAEVNADTTRTPVSNRSRP